MSIKSNCKECNDPIFHGKYRETGLCAQCDPDGYGLDACEQDAFASGHEDGLREALAFHDDPRDHLRLIREHLDIYDDEVLAANWDYEESWDNINFAMARICEMLGVEQEDIS